MFDETLGAAEARSLGEELEAARERERFFAISPGLNREHAAKGSHLLTSDSMRRVRRQSRIVHGLDRRVRRQKLGERHRVRAVRIYAKRERADAAHSEPAFEWRRHGTAAHLDARHALRQLVVLAENQRSTKDVAVATE